MRQRLNDIDGSVKAQVFSEWATKQKEQHMKSDTLIDSSEHLWYLLLLMFYCWDSANHTLVQSASMSSTATREFESLDVGTSSILSA